MLSLALPTRPDGPQRGPTAALGDFPRPRLFQPARSEGETGSFRSFDASSHFPTIGLSPTAQERIQRQSNERNVSTDQDPDKYEVFILSHGDLIDQDHRRYRDSRSEPWFADIRYFNVN